MMKPILMSAMLVSVISLDAFGQILDLNKGEKEKVSGYIGLKNIVQVKGMFALSDHPQRPISDDESYGFAGKTINKEYELNLERVLTNRKSLGLVIGKSKTSVDYYVENTSSAYSEVLRINDEIVQSITSNPLISDSYYGLKYKLYVRNKGGLAPVGRYWAFNFNIHNYEIDLTEVTIHTYDYDKDVGKKYKLENGIHKYKLSELGIASGFNRIIAKKVVLDYGVLFGILNSGRFVKAIGFSEEAWNTDPEAYIEDANLVRLSRFHFMKFYFSAGLIF